MQNWRKLFVVGTLRQFSSKDFMSKPCLVFAQNDSIKLVRLCEHESSSKGVTAAALEKNPSIPFYKYRASEASEKKKKKKKRRKKKKS